MTATLGLFRIEHATPLNEDSTSKVLSVVAESLDRAVLVARAARPTAEIVDARILCYVDTIDDARPAVAPDQPDHAVATALLAMDAVVAVVAAHRPGLSVDRENIVMTLHDVLRLSDPYAGADRFGIPEQAWEDAIEAAYWTFENLRGGRAVSGGRDDFKRAVRQHLRSKVVSMTTPDPKMSEVLAEKLRAMAAAEWRGEHGDASDLEPAIEAPPESEQVANREADGVFPIEDAQPVFLAGRTYAFHDGKYHHIPNAGRELDPGKAFVVREDGIHEVPVTWSAPSGLMSQAALEARGVPRTRAGRLMSSLETGAALAPFPTDAIADRCGVNALMWASTFVEVNGGDQPLLAGWFALAIQRALDLARRAGPEPATGLDRLQVSQLDAVAGTVTLRSRETGQESAIRLPLGSVVLSGPEADTYRAFTRASIDLEDAHQALQARQQAHTVAMAQHGRAAAEAGRADIARRAAGVGEPAGPPVAAPESVELPR